MKLSRSLGSIPIGGPNAASWAYHSQGNSQGIGRRRHGGKFSNFGLGCRTGDIISLELSFPSSDAATTEGAEGHPTGAGVDGRGATSFCNGATLRVYKNFKDMGVVFENISVIAGGLWPAVTLFKPGQSVAILGGDIGRGGWAAERLSSLSAVVSKALQEWGVDCEKLQGELDEHFRLLHEEVRAHEVAAREKLHAFRMLGTTLLQRQQELLSCARAPSGVSGPPQAPPSGTTAERPERSIDASEAAEPGVEGLDMTGLGLAMVAPASAPVSRDLGPTPARASAIVWHRPQANGATAPASASDSHGMGGTHAPASAVSGGETEGSDEGLQGARREVPPGREGPCPLECVLTDADRGRLEALRAHIAELRVTRVAPAPQRTRQPPSQGPKEVAERADKAGQLLAKKQALVDAYLENLKRANPLAPTDLQPLPPSHPLARSFQLEMSMHVLRGWVEQPSPACAAASVAGAWNAIFGLFDRASASSTRDASARDDPSLGRNDQVPVEKEAEDYAAGRMQANAAKMLRSRTGGGGNATELAESCLADTNEPSRAQGGLRQVGRNQDSLDGVQQAGRDLNRDTLAAAGLPSRRLAEIFGGHSRVHEDPDPGPCCEHGEPQQGGCLAATLKRLILADGGSEGVNERGALGSGGQGGNGLEGDGHHHMDGRGGRGHGHMDGLAGSGHGDVLARRQGMRRLDTWDVLKVYADMWRVEVDTARQKLAAVLELAAIEDLAPLESALERHWPAIDATVAMPVVPAFPRSNTGKRGKSGTAVAGKNMVPGSGSSDKGTGGALAASGDDLEDDVEEDETGPERAGSGSEPGDDVEEEDEEEDEASDADGGRNGQADGAEADGGAGGTGGAGGVGEESAAATSQGPGSVPAVQGQGQALQHRSVSLPAMPLPRGTSASRTTGQKTARTSLSSPSPSPAPSKAQTQEGKVEVQGDPTISAPGKEMGGLAVFAASMPSTGRIRGTIIRPRSAGGGTSVSRDERGGRTSPSLFDDASSNVAAASTNAKVMGTAGAAVGRAPYKPPSKAHVLHILRTIVAEASNTRSSAKSPPEPADMMLEMRDASANGGGSPAPSLTGMRPAQQDGGCEAAPACILKLGAIVSTDKGPAAQAVVLAARSYLEKRGALAKVTRERPSTAPVGNERLIRAIKHLAATYGVASAVRAWCFMGAAGTKRRQDYQATPSDSEPVLAQQWGALKAWVTRPGCALIYHLENHYSPVYATREWVAEAGYGRKERLVRQILAARPGQKPCAWIDFETMRATLLSWQGYAIIGVEVLPAS